MRRPVLLVALATAALALPAFAGEVTLEHARAASSLHEGGVDLVAYYLPVAGDALEVTVTYAASGSGAPARLVMAMADGDALRFGLPGHPGTLYGFARSGDRIIMTAVPVAGTATGANGADAAAGAAAKL